MLSLPTLFPLYLPSLPFLSPPSLHHLSLSHYLVAPPVSPLPTIHHNAFLLLRKKHAQCVLHINRYLLYYAITQVSLHVNILYNELAYTRIHTRIRKANTHSHNTYTHAYTHTRGRAHIYIHIRVYQQYKSCLYLK